MQKTSKIRDQNSIFEAALQGLPTEVLLTEADFRIVFLNQAAQNALGCNLQEIKGQPIQALLSIENPVGLVEKISQQLAHGDWFGELKFTTPTRRDLAMQVVVQALEDARGRCVGYCFLRFAQGAPSENRLTVDAARETSHGTGEKSAEDRGASSAAIVRKLTHRLNNPLVGVFNFSQLLLEKLPPEDTLHDLAKTIYEAAQECKDIITEWEKTYYDSDADPFSKG
ncbi:MAG: PAS domain-containing protein [bacterium]